MFCDITIEMKILGIGGVLLRFLPKQWLARKSGKENESPIAVACLKSSGTPDPVDMTGILPLGTWRSQLVDRKKVYGSL
jgi:hypothetical protein